MYFSNPVHRATLFDRLKGASDKLGRPTELSAEEENIIEERLIMMANWGFPLSSVDLACLIQDYLNSLGRSSRFTDNKPGPNFIKGIGVARMIWGGGGFHALRCVFLAKHLPAFLEDKTVLFFALFFLIFSFSYRYR